MNTINITNARNNLYSLVSDVNRFSTPITLTNSNGQNAVLLSESDWNSIQETLYINSIPKLKDKISASKKEKLEDCKVYDPNEEW